MTSNVSRRAALGLGAAAVAVVGTGVPAAAAGAAEVSEAAGRGPTERIRRRYRAETQRAGGAWQALISHDGQPVITDQADDVVEAYSVNKVAVAVAVLDKIDRGEAALTQRLEVTQDIVSFTGDGIFPLDGAYPSSVTVGHALALLLTVSDDTANRLAGLVTPTVEVNSTLVAKGFPRTQVSPSANPNRFYLGKTTPRETHDLLNALAAGRLLSPSSTAFLLKVLRSQAAHTDGIRRDLSSDERARVATKAGWFLNGRNEAGIVFDPAGAPALTYALFSQDAGDPADFGGTHAAVRARVALGRLFVDLTAGGGTPRAAYTPTNGG
ncbi:serine hydrolase [Actinokineospora globicatena]|uniref:Beta-lactamase n=1 Tax=Actinokineospora globicatena TaxID=103729 RepID=A0A9W6QLW2_9PSEU|nr:serine hydrolase [Actinokineospora globicatena]GLW90967.1 serine hydrolase [Actinokineospora globicatena]